MISLRRLLLAFLTVGVAGCAPVQPRALGGAGKLIGNENKTQVQIGLFEGDPELTLQMAQIVEHDLQGGGTVSVTDAKPLRLSSEGRPDQASWRAKGAGAILGGTAIRDAGGQINVRARLWSPDGSHDLGGKSWTGPARDLRAMGHSVSDFVQTTLTGTQGQYLRFRAKVAREGQRYVMYLTDIDGMDAQSAISAPRAIFMPTWSTDQRFIIYVTLETPIPTVWKQEANSGMREPAGPALQLVEACSTAAQYLAAPALPDPPSVLLDESWSESAGPRCKGALLTFADRADVALARRRLGIPTRTAPRLVPMQ